MRGASSNVFSTEGSALSKPVDKATPGVGLPLQGDVAHYQATVREVLERLAGQSGAQGGFSGLQVGPSIRTVNPDSGS